MQSVMERHPPAATLAAADGRDLEHVEYAAGSIVFSQGDCADAVLYVQRGAVRLSVVSTSGREGIIGVVTAGQFFGEACLANQPKRMETAIALSASTILSVPASEMARHLRTDSALADRFREHLLAMSLRIEETLADQLLYSCEQRLARALLRLAHVDTSAQGANVTVIPPVSQEVLAAMVGTTRTRVNAFMNRFRKLGLINYKANGNVTVYESLRTFVQAD